jgi:hypothetical protein
MKFMCKNRFFHSLWMKNKFHVKLRDENNIFTYNICPMSNM